MKGTKLLVASALALCMATAAAFAQATGSATPGDKTAGTAARGDKARDDAALTPIRPIRRVGTADWPAPTKEAQRAADEKRAASQDAAANSPATPPPAAAPSPPPQATAQKPEPPAGQNQAAQADPPAAAGTATPSAASIRLGTDAQGRVAVNAAQERELSAALRKHNGKADTDLPVAVGGAAPDAVRLGAVSADIVEVLPQFRGYSYFTTAENIVMVEPASKKIVALVPVKVTDLASRPPRAKSKIGEAQQPASTRTKVSETPQPASKRAGAGERRAAPAVTRAMVGAASTDDELDEPTTVYRGVEIARPRLQRRFDRTREPADDNDDVVIERRPRAVFGIFD